MIPLMSSVQKPLFHLLGPCLMWLVESTKNMVYPQYVLMISSPWLVFSHHEMAICCGPTCSSHTQICEQTINIARAHAHAPRSLFATPAKRRCDPQSQMDIRWPIGARFQTRTVGNITSQDILSTLIELVSSEIWHFVFGGIWNSKNNRTIFGCWVVETRARVSTILPAGIRFTRLPQVCATSPQVAPSSGHQRQKHEIWVKKNGNRVGS